MLKQLWKESYGAVCCISCYNGNKIKMQSITGFKVNNYLITDETAYSFVHANEIEFRFVDVDGTKTLAEKTIDAEEFANRIVDGVKDGSGGFTVINIDFPEFSDLPSLQLCFKKCHEIGSPIATMGYQIDQPNLSIHSGYISSFYTNDKDIRYIQFDACIKPGYSGGPIINTETGKVIGIIGYRLARSIKAYNSIKEIADANIKMLEEAIDNMYVKNIDPVQVLIAQENQIKLLAKEIHKTTFKNVGFALEIYEVISHFTGNLETQKLKQENS